jgi:hypothetical protein
MAETQPDQDPRIDQLISTLRGESGADPTHEANKASLELILPQKVSSALTELTAAIFSAQQTIGTRITEMNGQIEQTQNALSENSKTATAHSSALVS